MIHMEDWTLPGADEQPLFGTSHVPPDAHTARGVLLICHGFKGYKDYGLLPRLADAAAQAGLIAHRFNFSHSGMTRRTETFERPDLFEQDTWSKQVHDLQAVAQAAAHGRIAGQGQPQVWFGHSRGGVTCLLAASRAFQGADDRNLQPAAVVTAAAPDRACSLDDDQRNALHRLGRLPSPSSRTRQTLHIGRAWLEEIEADPQAWDPVNAARELRCPLLVVHGAADTTVPVQAARRLHGASGRRGQLVVIDGASHTFDAPNPLPVDQPLPDATAELIRLTCDFAADRCAAR